MSHPRCEIWAFTAGGSIESGVAVAGGIVCVRGTDNNLSAVGA